MSVMRGKLTNYNNNLGSHQFWLVETPVVEAAFRQPGRPAAHCSLRAVHQNFRLGDRKELEAEFPVFMVACSIINNAAIMQPRVSSSNSPSL